MKSISLSLTSAVALALVALPASAQQANYEGVWGCQASYTALDNFGNRTGGYVQQFMMGVYQGGAVHINGSMTGISGQSSFETQGQWKIDQSVFFAQTQGMEQSAFGTMPTMVMVVAQMAPDGRTMGYTLENPDPTRSYITDRSIYLCERHG